MEPRRQSEYRWGRYGSLEIEHADIFWTNFRGDEKIARTTGKVVNEKGTRNFNVYIYNTELAEEMRDQGWNVGIKTGLDGEEPVYYLPVEVRWRNRQGELLDSGLLPKAWMFGDKGEQELSEETIGILDSAEISDSGLTIRARRYQSVSGENKIKAFLSEGCFVVEESSDRRELYRRKFDNATAGGKFIFDMTIEEHVIEVLDDLEERLDRMDDMGTSDDPEYHEMCNAVDILSRVYELHKG